MIPRNMPELHRRSPYPGYRRDYEKGVRIHKAGGRGRPVDPTSLMSRRPWEAEGISRATWYRKHKGAADV